MKGATVLIEGRLRTRSWTDKQGAQHRTTEIMAERMQLGPRPMGAQPSSPAGGSSDGQRGQTGTISAKEEEIPTINLEEEDMKPLDDIPF